MFLVSSLERSLCTTGIIGSVFFLIAWWLPASVVWKKTERLISKSMNDKVEDELSYGIRFRIVCTVHNLLQAVLALKAISSPVLWNDSLHGTTSLSQLVVVISCGFFIWDVATAIFRIKIDGVVPIFHGLVCFSLLVYNVLTGNCHFYGVASILWEISTPFVHARWILYKIGLNDTKVYRYNGLTMIFAFTACRIVWGTYVFVRYFVLEDFSLGNLSPLTTRGLGCVALLGTGLNYFWYYKMLTLAHKALRKTKTN